MKLIPLQFTQQWTKEEQSKIPLKLNQQVNKKAKVHKNKTPENPECSAIDLDTLRNMPRNIIEKTLHFLRYEIQLFRKGAASIVCVTMERGMNAF